MQKQPNILLITTDQQRWDAIGYNNSAIKTPNLDRLASRGIVFDRAYTCNPVCTPARASILTGHYPSKHGAYTVGTSLPDDYPTIPGVLSRGGYFTGLLGKAHFRSCCSEGISFESLPNVHNTEFFRKWNGPYHGFEHCRLIIGHTTEEYSAGMHYRAWLEDKKVDIKRYFGKQFEYSSFGAWELPEEFHPSRWIADETIKSIGMSQDQGKPFFLWTSFQDPHNPCYVPEPWASLHKPEDVPVYPEYRKGEMDDRAPFYKAIIEDRPWPGGGSGDDPWLNSEKGWFTARSTKYMKTDLTSEKARREIMAKYYGMISLTDFHVGRIISALESRNLMENTIIVFTTDHGDYMGNHGLWWKGLPAYEDIHKLPMFVCHPDCRTPGMRSTAIQSSLDFGQTFLEYAGLPVPSGLQGVGQSRAWNDSHIAVRDHAIIEFRPTEGPFMQKTFVTDRYKIVFYNQRPHGELYDLEMDPDQYTNLWMKSEYQELKFSLMEKFISAEMDKDGALLPRTMWA